MSLQVWLPLNGNLNNQGLDSKDFAVNDGSSCYISNAGKIGSCYQFTANATSYIYGPDNGFMSKFINNHSFSLGCWIKTTASSVPVLTLSYGLRLWGNYLYLMDSSSTVQAVNYTNVSDGQWHHIMGTYDVSTGTAQLYIDGIPGTSATKASYVSSWNNGLYVGGDVNNFSLTSWHFNGLMNDVRIYDHCLSATEVKDLAKGLIIHYPLKDGYIEPTINYLQTKTLDLSGWSSYGFGSHGVKTIMPGMTGVEGGDVCKVTDGYTNTSNMSIEMANWSIAAPTLTTNGTACFSAYVKGEGATIGKAGFLHVYNSNGSETCSYTVANFTFTAQWQRISGVFTWTGSSASSNSYSCYVVGQMCQNEYFYFCNPQLEIKNHVTPYTAVSRSETVAYDSAGYGYNGSMTNSGMAPTWTTSSARYNNCYQFDGVNNSIQIPFNSAIKDTMFSINFWFYKSEWGSKGYETLIGGPSGFEVESKSSSTNEPKLVAYNWGGGSATYSLNTWNMVTMVRTSSDTKFYLNGNLVITGTAGTIPSGNYFIAAWNSYSQQNFKGKMSDFRIYSTALTASDILDLYNAPIKIAKNGSLITNGEVVE